jgi:hypothetical protein
VLPSPNNLAVHLPDAGQAVVVVVALPVVLAVLREVADGVIRQGRRHAAADDLRVFVDVVVGVAVYGGRLVNVHKIRKFGNQKNYNSCQSFNLFLCWKVYLRFFPGFFKNSSLNYFHNFKNNISSLC